MKNKKWIFIILALVVIGVILAIVFINLFKEKDTKQVANSLHSYVEEGYLHNDEEQNENQNIKDYLGKVIAPEAEQYLAAFKAFEIYGQFLDREFSFVEYTNVYKNLRKSTTNNLSKAQKAANSLYSYVDEHPNALQDGFWTPQTWQDCEKYVVTIVNSTADALINVFAMYQEGAVKNLHANDFTKAIKFATENCVKQLKSEQKESSGTNLLKMAEAYLTLNKEKCILQYQDNEVLKTKVKIILGESGDKSAEYSLLLSGSILA